MLIYGAIALGLLLLLAGGAALVHGASALASRMQVPPMVIGLTIVAFGTSVPELVVNIIGASHGATELAFGNVIGSNVANLALVLGAAALIRPIAIQGKLVQREVPLLLLATIILTLMALDTWFDGSAATIGRTDAAILLLLFGIFIYVTTLDVMRRRKNDALFADINRSPLVPPPAAGRYSAALIALGICMLFAGGEITIANSLVLAAHLHVPEAIVGLFVVALGTSLPELATSVVAAARREPDLALGNVVGSNLFNTLFVLPASAMVAPVSIPLGGIGDLTVSLLCAAALIPVFVFGKARLGRAVAAGLIVFFVVWAILRTSA